MRAEKIAFALLACVLVVCLTFVALNSIPKQPVAFFAYGTNLAKSTLNARAGGFLNATAVELPGYLISFASQDSRPTEFGVATLVQNESAKVSGALYYLTPEQMALLDKQSSVPNFYERREVLVVAGGREIKAQAYFLSGSAHLAAPSRPYYLAAQAGMKEWGYATDDLDAAMAAAASN